MRAVIGLMMLAMQDTGSCDPASLEAAGITPGDGGVWVAAEGGATFIPATSELPGGEQLKDLPPMEILCQLLAGDWNMKNDYETRQGIWIVNIEDERLLGPAAPGAKYIGTDGAQLRYSYRKPGTTDQKVSIAMGFERMLVVSAMGAELFGDGSAMRGHPWPDPWFLNRIEAQGLDVQPLCWDPFLRNSTEYHSVSNDWCANIGKDFVECENEDPKQCFY